MALKYLHEYHDRRSNVEVTLWLMVSQSVSMSWYRAPLWDFRPDITSCRNVAVRNLRSCFCGRPLWRKDGSAICSVITQWFESLRTRNHTLLSHLRLHQPGGPGSCIYIPQEQGDPVIHLGTGFTTTKLFFRFTRVRAWHRFQFTFTSVSNIQTVDRLGSARYIMYIPWAGLAVRWGRGAFLKQSLQSQ
jgi:hypothetical protein